MAKTIDGDISALIKGEIKPQLEKEIRKKLFIKKNPQTSYKKGKDFVWRISEDSKMNKVICSIFYNTLEKEIRFWCDKESLTPNIMKFEKFFQEIGLHLEDLRKPK